jgi:uncharacterized membrane protein
MFGPLAARLPLHGTDASMVAGWMRMDTSRCVPSAPTSVAGSLYYLQEGQVKRLKDVAVRDAVKCIMQLGVGSRKLLAQARLASGSRVQAPQKSG